MTWSLQNTINWETNTSVSDHNAAWAYFFDTFINGVSTWHVTGWPGGTQPEYRKVKITLNNKYNNNAAYDMYFEVHIGALLDGVAYGLRIMLDAQYTSSPQDNDSITKFNISAEPTGLFNQFDSGFGKTGVLEYPDAISSGYGPYKFWISDQNNDARLVTKGRRVVFYWPGWTSGYFYEDSNWDGTYNNNGQHVFGIIYSNRARVSMPGTTSARSDTDPAGVGTLFSKPLPHLGVGNNAAPVLCWAIIRTQNRADVPVTPEIDYSTTQKSLLVSGFGPRGLDETIPMFDAINVSDVAVYAPYSKSGNIDWFSNEQGEIVRINGGDYWLLAASDTVTESLVFNFGATQPSFS